MRKFRSIPAVLGAAIALGLVGCSEKQKEPQPADRSDQSPAASKMFAVSEADVADLKPVLATVRSKRIIEARVRTPGTVATLRVQEGDHVEPGQILGLVADPKIALRLKASDAQILALASRLAAAQADFDRTTELFKRGVAPQARLDQTKSAFDVATNELSAARSERAVIEKQVEEGQVLAPAKGRILRVPVTEGSVVLPGESIATIAANEYLLRLEVPERHARFMQKGDTLRVGARGLSNAPEATVDGRIVQIYPEIQNGRVIADAEVPDLGDYFVGERTLAWISAGTRRAIAVPAGMVFKRHGLEYVRLAAPGGSTTEVVVQLGQTPVAVGQDTVEVLAGLRAGDRLVWP